MNLKQKSLILSIFLIFTIQILLFINNRQKSSIKYFIWNIQNISIGQLITFSFTSGLLISSILNSMIINDVKNSSIKDDNNNSNSYDENFNNKERNIESNEIPPERDLRDTQPTISVNYRVIKDNYDNELKGRNQNTMNNKYEDDWDKNDSEW